MIPQNIPAFRITLDGKDLTATIKPRLVSLNLTENREGEADQLDIVLSDHDGQLAIPPLAAKIDLQIGWLDTGLIDKGSFTVDEVEHSGAPDLLTLRARSASLIDTFRKPQEYSYHDTTIGAVIQQIAKRHSLRSSISPVLAKKKIAHVDQTQESDAAFLRRLGKSFDAVSTVKKDTLIFAPAGQSKTASGKALPTMNIVRSDGDQHRFHSAGRDAYSGVRAYWHDPKKASKQNVVAGLAGNCKRLRTLYASESDALENAKAEWDRIRRGVFTFSLTLAIGKPTLIPETPVKVSGFKQKVDETDWVTIKATHAISSSGYTTQAELEMKPAAE